MYAPPFSAISNNGQAFYGFHIDLMNNICKRLQLTCTFKAITLDNQINLLNQGDIDLAFSSTPITDTDARAYIYSLPYLNSNAQFVSLSSNNTINNLNDVKAKTIGVLNSTLYHAFVNSHKEYGANIKPFGKASELILALSNKDVDTILVNKNMAIYLLNIANYYKLVGPEIAVGEGYGLIALKNNEPLIKEIDSALLDMESSGDYLSIYQNYFGR